MATTQKSSTKQEILEYLLKQSRATAFELAETLDISPQAIRRHIKDFFIDTRRDGTPFSRLSVES
jgi:DeoR family transcriptional regulator, suf operon transcriptional repressor